MSPERNVAATGSRARRADAEHNRAALLAAARRLLGERGADVPLDEIARGAGVANATLYRHFPTRAELILAVYAGEVAELVELAERLLRQADPAAALADWLRAFVRHVAGKRELALALPDGPDDHRGERFDDWHASMRAATERLVARARETGAVRSGVSADDLLALATGIAMTGLAQERLDGLLALAGSGYATGG